MRLLQRNIMIGHWNVRGIKTRCFELEKYSERFDVLLLEETLLKAGDDFCLPGFSVLRRDERHGTVIAVRNRPGLTYLPLDFSSFCSVDRDVQGITISDGRRSGSINIINVYISKATSAGDWEFLHHIESMGSCIISGDFNARSPVWSCREWPPGVANVEFESLLEELMAESDALLATDGSVIREPLPRSGWGCFIRSAELTQSVSGATRLVLSSMRAETEAVTVGLSALNQLLPDCQHIVVATDSQSLLRKLEGGVSPPEWWTDRRITWLYCPGHAGVEVNEKADRLAGNGAPATSRIVLSASDFQQLLKFKMETDDARKPNPGEAEVGRMVRVGLRPGWIARSGLCGPRGRMACQLACGTVSRRTLADICTLGGAETAWRRIFGSRSVDEAVAEE
ncbi:hypothetical protein FJT64_008037 [Amphibalanus amphitrite]|uniref:Uncharacterized protein n=1 Tax=Amphibalanus amphitrite TaxID=1232801 RepID=A0A6A4VS85_AMPAM|nr:hypothetical protein FJT64_008037 [Amphibalanus amphitrite]